MNEFVIAQFVWCRLRTQSQNMRGVKLASIEVSAHLPGRRRGLAFEVVEGDIITFSADLVAFKTHRPSTVPTCTLPGPLPRSASMSKR